MKAAASGKDARGRPFKGLCRSLPLALAMLGFTAVPAFAQVAPGASPADVPSGDVSSPNQGAPSNAAPPSASNAIAAPSPGAPAPPLLSEPNLRSASLWRDQWPQFRTSEGVVTLAAAVATGAMLLIGPVDRARWQGGILFDNAVRDELRTRNPHTRQTFRTIGDYTYHLSPILPLIDVVVLAGIAHGDRKLAVNLGLMMLEAYSYTGFTYFSSTEIFARARPDSRCQDPGGVCDTQSFYGGHAAISATGAGLVCANHTRVPLYGVPALDIGACVLAASNALLTGTTRMVADRHYATDIIVGTSFGFGFGYLVPVLLHYSYGKANTSIAVGPVPSCGGDCLGVNGTF